MFELGGIIPIIIGIIVLIILYFLVSKFYVKAPADQALIISGFRKREPIIGRSTFVIPILERVDSLNLSMMSIDVKTNNWVSTSEYVQMKVDAAAKIKISDDPELIKIASQNFLNKDHAYIVGQITDTIEGNLREIIGESTLDDLIKDPKSFGDKVSQNAAPDIERMGLDLVAFHIQTFEDKDGIVDNLAEANAAKIQKQVDLDKINIEEEKRIAAAESKDRANAIESGTQEKVNDRNHKVSIKKLELDREREESEAKTAANKERVIAEQRKVVVEKQAEADIAKANADNLYNRKIAEGKERLEIDNEKYKREKESEAELTEARNRAEGIKITGEAEARVTTIKGIASAKSIEAEGLAVNKSNNIIIAQKFVENLPEIVRAAAQPFENIDKITIYDGGGGENGGMKNYSSMILNNLPQILNSVEETTGIKITDIVEKVFDMDDMNDFDGEDIDFEDVIEDMEEILRETDTKNKIEIGEVKEIKVDEINQDKEGLD